MSHYETPEQRQIRELRTKLNALTSQLNNVNEMNGNLKDNLANLRRQYQAQLDTMLEKMRESQAAAARAASSMSERMKELDKEVKAREEKQLQIIAAMQRQHQKQIEHMEARMEEEKDGLRKEISRTRSEMEKELGELRQETDAKLNAQRTETQHRMEELRTDLRRDISAVDQKLDSLAAQITERENGKKELAVYWAQEAARMINQIRDIFRSQLIDEVALGKISRRMEAAQSDIASGVFESAISNGREAFYEAMDMQDALAAATLEWNYWANAVKTRENQLLQELNVAENRVYQVQSCGETVEFDNGIDYWTYGQLTITRDRIAATRKELEQLESMTTEELQDKEEQLRRLQMQLALVENASEINVAMSVSRYETASKIAAILGEEYEQLEYDGEYFGTEDREEYHAFFQNPMTGDQVVVVITPIPDEQGVVTNHIDLLVGNADNNPVTRDQMGKQIAAGLRTRGVEGCSFNCANRFEDNTAEEVERVGDIEAVERGDEKVRAKVPNSPQGRAATASPTVTRATRKKDN